MGFVGVVESIFVDDVGDKLEVDGDDVVLDCSLLLREKLVIGDCWIWIPVCEEAISCNQEVDLFRVAVLDGGEQLLWVVEGE